MERSSEDISINVPNAGRVYDYVLGGSHNFEADRQAAEYMISLIPSTRKWVRMLRLFLQEAVQELAEEGFDKFLDLGSGLPTSDHIHALVPHARVVYVDVDPVAVSYGTEILGDKANVRYIQADIRDIEAILKSPIIQEMFGDERKVAIGLNAMLVFLTDDEVRHIARALYDWAAPGSKLFCTIETKDPDLTTPAMENFVAMFKQMGVHYQFSTLEESRELMLPWVADERGFQHLAEWLGVQEHFTPEDSEGVDLGFYGAILVKA
jgi:O-methyltransferase involved in polyketide biosynthesis